MANEIRSTVEASLTGDAEFWKSLAGQMAKEHNAIVPWLNRLHVTEAEKTAMRRRMAMLMAGIKAANTAAQKADLVRWGFHVGIRHPMINTKHPGVFMVCQVGDETELARDYSLPTEDGANGPWAIVGNDMDELIAQAHRLWADEYEGR